MMIIKKDFLYIYTYKFWIWITKALPSNQTTINLERNKSLQGGRYMMEAPQKLHNFQQIEFQKEIQIYMSAYSKSSYITFSSL